MRLLASAGYPAKSFWGRSGQVKRQTATLYRWKLLARLVLVKTRLEQHIRF